jgi:hypothetical protein
MGDLRSSETGALYVAGASNFPWLMRFSTEKFPVPFSSLSLQQDFNI